MFFSLEGRISRKNWWIGNLLLTPVQIGLSVLLYWLLGISPHNIWNDDPVTPIIATADAIIFVIILHPSLAIDIKRLHDRGSSAYFLVPFYLSGLLMIAVEGIYRQLFIETPYWQWTLVPMTLYSIWLLFELGFRKGQPENSKYGPDPLVPLTEHADEVI
jgi:uncharacterized membrane protein YhaH (DUF805 family)